MSSRKSRYACVEDVDEPSGAVVEGSAKYARSEASPTKERSNTGKPRNQSRRERRGSFTSSSSDSEDSTPHPSPARKDGRSQSSREKERAHPGHKKAIVTTRPPAKHSKTMPPPSSYYGVQAAMTPSTSRPRGHTTADRPASYYASSARPPPANIRFYSHQQQGPPPLVPASYPAQPWAIPHTPGYPMPPPQQPMHQQDYFASRPLEHRFGRPQSAMGLRSPRGSYEGYEQEEERQLVQRPVPRRTSLHKKMFKPDDGARPMPPPPRPATTRPQSSAPFRPPPTTPARRSHIYDTDDLGGHSDLFQDISPQQNYGYGGAPVAPVRRSKSRRPSERAQSIVYDDEPPYHHTEIARRPSRSGRRSSYMSGGGGYEDKLREATSYQHDVGNATVPLTEETLRKANKNSNSSRSTRSSGSHDESDYRYSATTRTTTRSGGDEDITTIRAKGNIKVMIGDAEMQCEDGAEISFSSGRGPGYRGGSDKSSYMDQEDRRTRIDRPALRARTSSQAGSYSRAPMAALPMPMPRYDAAYDAPYDSSYPPYGSEIPPYPAYPTRPTGSFF